MSEAPRSAARADRASEKAAFPMDATPDVQVKMTLELAKMTYSF
jgi:hypothetical protein